MTTYTVFKILEHNNLQLLLIKTAEGRKVSVYNEHTGNTVMQMIEPTVENLERAIRIIKGEDTGDF